MSFLGALGQQLGQQVASTVISQIASASNQAVGALINKQTAAKPIVAPTSNSLPVAPACPVWNAVVGPNQSLQIAPAPNANSCAVWNSCSAVPNSSCYEASLGSQTMVFCATPNDAPQTAAMGWQSLSGVPANTPGTGLCSYGNAQTGSVLGFRLN